MGCETGWAAAYEPGWVPIHRETLEKVIH